MSDTQGAANTTLALSNREEEDLLKQTKKEALSKCGDITERFAQCATGRTVTVAWACRGEYRELQNCMRQYTSGEAMAERRREYLREKRAASAKEQHPHGDVSLATTAPPSSTSPPTLKSSSGDVHSRRDTPATSYMWHDKPSQRVV